MRKIPTTAVMVSLIVIGLSGCGPKATSTTSHSVHSASMPEPSPNESPATPPTDNDSTSAAEENPSNGDGKAKLTGRITLDGEIPEPRKIQITKDEETCGAAGTTQDVTGRDGGVANVVVEIRDVKSDSPWEWSIPEKGYVLRQKNCQFAPNMIVIPNGKDISIYNDDPVGHNVNTGAWNQMQPSGPDPLVKPIEGKAPIKVGCNIHSWMEAWVYPVQNPFYAVTDETGNFEVEGVPPGKYRITIWHAHLGRENQRVTLEAGQSAKIEHTFSVPQS